MAGSDRSDKSEDRVGYIDAGGHVHSTPEGAIEGSLAFEAASGTGSGCSQSYDNVDSGQDSDQGDGD